MTASVAEVLSRLTTLSQELAGAFRPATIVEVVARALTEQLAPGRLSVLLLDLDANRLTVAYHNGPRPATTDEPLLQLALRRGPLVFPDRVAARAAELGATVDRPTPSSWLGVPINAGSRTIGAIALESDRSKALDDGALMFARAVVASGLDAPKLLARSQEPDVKAKLIENTQSAVERGAFGSPTFFVGKEMFFGKDQLRDVEDSIVEQISHAMPKTA